MSPTSLVAILSQPQCETQLGLSSCIVLLILSSLVLQMDWHLFQSQAIIKTNADLLSPKTKLKENFDQIIFFQEHAFKMIDISFQENAFKTIVCHEQQSFC